MLTVSLAAFCSYGSCGDTLVQAMDDATLGPLLHPSNSAHVKTDEIADFQKEASILADFYQKKSVIAESFDMSTDEDPILENFRDAFNITSSAAGLLSLDIKQLQSMKGLAASAGDSEDSSEGTKLNNLYQARLCCIDEVAYASVNGINVFSGGMESNTYLDTPPASIGEATTDIASNSQLSEIGPIELVKVVRGEVNFGIIKIIANDIFSGTIELGKTGSLRLTSHDDYSNFIMLDIIGTGLTTIEEIQTQLNQLFQYTERRDHITLRFKVGTASDDIAIKV